MGEGMQSRHPVWVSSDGLPNCSRREHSAGVLHSSPVGKGIILIQGLPFDLMHRISAALNMSISSMCSPGSGTKSFCMSAILQARRSAVQRQLICLYIIEPGTTSVAEVAFIIQSNPTMEGYVLSYVPRNCWTHVHCQHVSTINRSYRLGSSEGFALTMHISSPSHAFVIM